MSPQPPSASKSDPLLEGINFQELEQKQPPSKLKRLLIITAALLIILLFVSYIFVSYPLGHIIEGKIESQAVQDGRIQFGDLTLVFEQQTKQQLDTFYLQEQKVEFSLCLQGTKDHNTYHITSLYQPKTYEQTFSHVTFEPCSQDTLIMLHTHPYQSCLASDADLATLQKTKEYNPNILMIVMCEPDRFSVYS